MPFNNMPAQNNRMPLGLIFRQKREEKGLLIRQVAAVTELDQAIISRIENCDRIPTKEQLIKLAGLYNMDVRETMSAWLAEKMVRDYGDEPYVTEALREAHDRVMYSIDPESNLLFSNSVNYNLPPDNPDEKKGTDRKGARKGKKSGK